MMSLVPTGEADEMSAWRRTLPLLAWVAALVAGVALFHALGRGQLAPPPLTDPGAWGPWLEAREPTVAAVAVLRLVVLALAWYLVGTTTVGIVARLLRAARLVRVADALTVPAVRRLLRGALGVGLATAMVGAATAPVPKQAPAPTLAVSTPSHVAPGDEGPVLRAADEGPTLRAAAGEGPTLRAAVDAGPTLRAVAEEAGEVPAVSHAGASTDEPRLRRSERDILEAVPGLRQVDTGASDDPAPEDGHHRVRSGESLWSIAQDTLAEAWEREPTDAEVLAYWHRLIDDNRAMLPDPDNPDLIFPGDRLHLPSVAGDA